jgi:hypothetical protein
VIPKSRCVIIVLPFNLLGVDYPDTSSIGPA